MLPLTLFSQKTATIACRIWAKNSIVSAKYIAGISYEIKGEVPKSPVIIACKHQSAWETALFHLLPHQTAFILKKELLYVPIFRHYVTGSGQIPVDRKAGASTIKNMVRSVRARIADGRDVVIFPEGTRSKYGQPSDYKPGVAALYSGVDADIVPVAHNSGKFWPRNSFWKRPGVVTVSFLPAIEKGLSKKEFAQELKKRIEDECAVIAAQKS